MTRRMSSPVTTEYTPWVAWAALVSMWRMRPCGTVLRAIFAHSMPGRRRLWTYSARPVTLARASTRGSERPIWPTETVFVSLMNRAPFAERGAADRHRKSTVHLAIEQRGVQDPAGIVQAHVFVDA